MSNRPQLYHLLATSLLSIGTVVAQETPKPNIILFLVDDMGWQDTSEPFWHKKTKYNELYETPNMEKLARQGVKFTQAYACAISSPTRTSLMTGMNAARHRVTSWTTHKDKPSDQQDDVLVFPSWNYNGLQPTNGVINNTLTATTLPQILQQNGYRTIHCGKGHFGADQTKGANPLLLGFDLNIGGGANGQPGSYTPNQAGIYTNGNAVFDVKGVEKYGKQGLFLTEALTLRAKDELQKSLDAQQPFYLYMSHYAVHTPIQKDDRFYQKYRNKGMGHLEAAYASLLEGMDKSLGDLMYWLQEKNIAENTIILFMSDNGGLSQHSRGNDRPSHTHNLPLNSGKASAYEGGIRVPMIVKWSGTTTPNTESDHKVIIEDFFPTILEMAGITDYQTTQTVDGSSFVATLKDQQQEEKDLFWHFPNKSGSGPGIGTYSAIRSGDYKLIYWWKNQSLELYNIKEDIGEKRDLIYDSNQKERINALSQKLTDFLKKTKAQRPKNKSTQQLIIYPNQAKVPTAPVAPTPSDERAEHWYKVHDNRQPNNFWTLNDKTKQLNIVTEPIPNDTTTADKLFKIVATADKKAYKIYARNHKNLPISATNTSNSTPLYANSTYPIHTWTLTPSQVVPNHYLIAAQKAGQQLNSYAFDGSHLVSFWLPKSDNDPGNRWAFIPAVLKGELQAHINNTKIDKPLIITSHDGKIVVKGSEKFTVYTPVGKICNPQKRLPRGIYIVKTTHAIQKIIL